MAEALHFTGNAEADELLAADPLALLVGFVLDQQVTVPTAFFGPLKLKQRLGTLDAAAIAATDPERLVEVFREKPAIHRFPGNMAKRVQELCAVVAEEYDGDAGRVWRDAADTADLKRRIEALPGFGEMKVKALASVLAQRFGSRWRSRSCPTTRCSATSTRPEALAEYQAAKRAYKASLRAAAGLIELRTYRDGGQSAEDVAREVAEFLDAAQNEPRARALRHPPPRRGGRDRHGGARSARRSAASPSGSSTTSTTPGRSRCRRRRRPRRSCSRRCRSRPSRSPACPT